MSDHDAILTMRLELEQLRKDFDDLEEKVSYYDRLALKWGGACMGAIVIGALISSNVQKLCQKILALLSQ